MLEDEVVLYTRGMLKVEMSNGLGEESYVYLWNFYDDIKTCPW